MKRILRRGKMRSGKKNKQRRGKCGREVSREDGQRSRGEGGGGRRC